MVSKTPTKFAKSTPKSTRRRRKKPSPLKSLIATPSAVAASIDRSFRSCRRRLIKIFTCFGILGTPKSRKHGFRRLKTVPHDDPAPPAPPTPLPPPSFPGRKTVILDLDETLVHAKTDPPPERYDFTVHPVIDGQILTFYVLKRPGVDELLKEAAKAFEVVVFTAGLREYASLVLDHLDPGGEIISHRLYRDSCKEMEGKFVKDLSVMGRDLDRVVIVDDNPNAYAFQPENAVPVAPFINDLGDRELQKVIKFLEVAPLFDDTRDAILHYLSDNANQKSQI
uniref:Probable C-terminal domain small phosphatase n=1 Tax=Elaeis guineensis var. tenera TaxID=51953 RepID=A0A6I9QXQ9_ELAGV|nr:probable C-terminal domain small phosphatase [Elaeis guineensis]